MGRTTKVYAINTERKRILKQRREKVLQNAKDRKLGKVNAPVALQARIRANRASKDTQNITRMNDAIIGDDNTDAVIGDDNNTDAIIGDDNTDAVIGDDDTDAIIGDDNTDDAVIGDDNTDNAVTGEASTVHVPLPPCSKGKAKDPNQIKTSSKHATPTAEPSIGDPLLNDQATVKASGHTLDLGDVPTL